MGPGNASCDTIYICPFCLVVLKFEVEAKKNQKSWTTKTEEGKNEIEDTQRIFCANTFTFPFTCKLMNTLAKKEDVTTFSHSTQITYWK